MKKFRFIFLITIYFLLQIAVNIVHPVTTIYVNELNLPTYYFGFFFSLMSLGQVVGAIIWGPLSDKIGRKIPIIIGIIGYAVFQFCFGFINTIPPLILVFRFFSGFFVSSPQTLFLSLALDYSDSDKKTRNLSILSSGNLLGTAIGYEIGGVLHGGLNFTISQVFIFQVVFTTITGLLGILLKDKKNEEATKTSTKKFSFSSFKGLSIYAGIFLFGILLMTLAQTDISKYLDVLFIDKGYDALELGNYTLVTGITGFVITLFIVPMVLKIKKIKEEVLIVVFTILEAITLIFTFKVGKNLLIMCYTTHMLFVIFKAFVTPLEQSYISRFASKNNIGSIMGARQSTLSIGNVIGPLIGSAVYVKGDSLIMMISALILALSGLVYLIVFIFNKNKQKEKTV